MIFEERQYTESSYVGFSNSVKLVMLFRLLTLSCCVLVTCVAQKTGGGENVGYGDVEGAPHQGEGIEGNMGENVVQYDVQNPGEEAGGAVESNKAVSGDLSDKTKNQQAPIDGIVIANNSKVAKEKSPASKSEPQTGKTNANETKIPTDMGKKSTSGSQTSATAGNALGEETGVAGVDGPDGINDGIVEPNYDTGNVANNKSSKAGVSKPSPLIPGGDIHEGGVDKINTKQNVEGNDGPFGSADIDSPLRRQVGTNKKVSGEAADGQYGDAGRKGIKGKPTEKAEAKGGA